MNLKSFLDELKRRNVFKVATAYAIAAWLIIQVVATIAPQLNFPDWVPSFVTILTLIGFPIALIIAWAFELTPDGLKKTDSVETSKEFQSTKSKKINTIIISALSLAIVFLLIERVFFAQSKSSNDLYAEASIAVLPFVNMSDDKENEYFSDGLSEELLNGLAKIDGMQVAGRTSSFSFKGKNEDIRDIANQLNVEHVLEGSVRKDGDKIRITAQLIKAENGYHLWSETYDRELQSVFKVQEEISREVVKELKLRILPEDDKELSNLPTNNTEAYDLFLQATQREVSRQANDIQAAIDLYKKAIDKDENFGLAHSRLAIAYSLLHQYGNLRLEESMDFINENVEKAIAIGDNLGMAYLAQGMGYSDIPGEDMILKAGESYKKALEYLPNYAYLQNAIYINYNALGERDKADKHLLRAFELDPLSPPIATNTASYYAGNKDYDKANEIADKIIAKYPDYTQIYSVKLGLLTNSPFGDLSSGFKLIHKALKQKPNDLALLLEIARLSRDLDMLELTSKYLEKLQLLYPNNFDIIDVLFGVNAMKGKHQLNLDIMQSFVDRFGDMARKPTVEPISLSYILLKDYNKAKKAIEESFPEFKDGTVVINKESVNGKPYDLLSLTEIYVRLLLEMNQKGRIPTFVEKIEKYYGYENFKEKPLDSLDIGQLFQKSNIEGMKGNIDAMLETRKMLAYDRKVLRQVVTDVKLGLVINMHADNPKVQEAGKEVMSEIHKMRAEVIAYLKSEGEWDETP